MIGRIPLIAVLVGSLAFAGQAAADHGSRSDALITGAVVGAVVGGVIASSRHAPPVYVEVAPPPPRVVYYEPRPRYYEPYPVVVEHHYYKPRHHKHHRHHRKHHRHDRAYYRW